MNDKKWIVIAIAALAASTASAEMFKCKGPDGKTVFSDTRCENEAPKPPAAAPKDTSGRYQLTDEDKARIKVLEGVVDKKGTNSEQKSAAQWEMGNIRMGADVRLTKEERDKRDALTAQLATADQKKRTELLGQLRVYYDK